MAEATSAGLEGVGTGNNCPTSECVKKP